MSSSNEKPTQEPSPPEEDPAIQQRWRGFMARGDPFFHNSELECRQLEEASSRLFSPVEKMRFEIQEVTENEDHAITSQKWIVDSEDALERYLSRNSNPNQSTNTFITICAPSSIKPLKITSSAMVNLLTHHNVSVEFIDLLLFFSNGHEDSEVGPGSMTSRTSSDGSYEIQYRYNYVESALSSWATRQVGAYHRHTPLPHPCSSSSSNLFIFLHPKTSPIAQTCLEHAISTCSTSQGDWYGIHVLLLSSYFSNWRLFLSNLSAEMESIASDALSLDFSTETHYRRGLNILQSLHNLEDQVLPLTPRLRSILSTVSALKTFNEKKRKGEHRDCEIDEELSAYESRLNGHLARVDLLEKRTQETLKLLGVALNLKSQATTVDINRNIWSLTKDTVDDSATVRVVTLVTLTYLPASFVSGLLGMNLFSFGSSGNSGFAISSQFWIFIALALPFTLLTVGYWFYMVRRRKQQKKKDRDLHAQKPDV